MTGAELYALPDDEFVAAFSGLTPDDRAELERSLVMNTGCQLRYDRLTGYQHEVREMVARNGKTAESVNVLDRRAAAAAGNAAHGWPAPIDLLALAGREPQPPQFIVPDWLPAGYATLLAGHGGVGKSAIGLHLAVCIALGCRWAGIECSPRRVLYLDCEDREGAVHWRLDRICRHVGISMAELPGRLDIQELVGHDSMLWERDPRTGYTVTPAYGQLQERMKAGYEVLIVDGISDTYGGNEIARGEVKRYVNTLLALIPANAGAVLLIGHVNRPTAAGGATSEGYSGSTAWHNAVRSRMYLYAETTKDDDDPRPRRSGRLILELQKAQFAPVDQLIGWRWDDAAHMFLPEAAPTAFDRHHQQREEQRSILLALKACASAGIAVPAATTGRRTAYHVLTAQPIFPASLKSRPATRRFWAAVETLRAMKHVQEGIRTPTATYSAPRRPGVGSHHSGASNRRRERVCEKASGFFCEHVLQHRLVEREIGD